MRAPTRSRRSGAGSARRPSQDPVRVPSLPRVYYPICRALEDYGMWYAVATCGRVDRRVAE
eukprot:6169230-Alexandrium_andersonii.AAC.1